MSTHSGIGLHGRHRGYFVRDVNNYEWGFQSLRVARKVSEVVIGGHIIGPTVKYVGRHRNGRFTSLLVLLAIVMVAYLARRYAIASARAAGGSVRIVPANRFHGLVPRHTYTRCPI